VGIYSTNKQPGPAQMGHNKTVNMDYIIFIMIAAAASIAGTIALQLVCNKLDSILLRRETESLRQQFNFNEK
jgi:hypothetical protein